MNISNLTVLQIKQKIDTLQIEEYEIVLKQLKKDNRRSLKKLALKLESCLEQHLKEKKRQTKLLKIEKFYRSKGFKFIAGVDEAGRGPLAGPVVAAAVILPEEIYIDGINDSKKLTPRKRELIYEDIKSKALSINFCCIDNDYIDKVNIHKATLEAMKRAVLGLSITPEILLIDALKLKGINIPQQSIIRGDSLSMSIAAASIVAKVERDRIMKSYDKIYPHYGFDKNKGYPTREHIEQIKKHGFSPIHRRSFRVKGLYDM